MVERGGDGSIVLDVHGVGYEVFVPLGSLGRLPNDEPVTLHVHTHVREDALVLYGFPTADDRAAFRTLMTVSSVGPKLALAVMSHLTARELAAAIAQNDRTAFQKIPGVGKKIVERLVLELKDKVAQLSSGNVSASSAGTIAAPMAPSSARLPGPLGGVAGMLVSMGFRPSEADRAVAAIATSAEGKDAGTLLREALAALG